MLLLKFIACDPSSTTSAPKKDQDVQEQRIYPGKKSLIFKTDITLIYFWSTDIFLIYRNLTKS